MAADITKVRGELTTFGCVRHTLGPLQFILSVPMAAVR